MKAHHLQGLFMNVQECYRQLDVPATATWEEVRRAYKRLCIVWHPDRFHQQSPGMRSFAESKLTQINVAYGKLKEHFEAKGATPDTDDSRSDTPHSDEEPLFAECSYLGGDPRLRKVSALARKRRAVVQISSAGILLITLGESGVDETVDYPSSSILEFERGHEHWGCESCAVSTPQTYVRPLLSPAVILIAASDPNGIAERLQPQLQFRDEYAAKLCQKALKQLFCPTDVVALAEKKRAEAQKAAAAKDDGSGVFGVGVLVSACILGVILVLASLTLPDQKPETKVPDLATWALTESGGEFVPADQQLGRTYLLVISMWFPSPQVSYDLSDLSVTVTRPTGQSYVRDLRENVEVNLLERVNDPSATRPFSVRKGGNLTVSVPMQNSAADPYHLVRVKSEILQKERTISVGRLPRQ